MEGIDENKSEASGVSQPGEQEANAREEGNIDQPLLDAKGAAQLFMISESMFYKLNRSGKTPPPVRVGSLLRWRKKEIMEWIANGCPASGKIMDKKSIKYGKQKNKEK